MKPLDWPLASGLETFFACLLLTLMLLALIDVFVGKQQSQTEITPLEQCIYDRALEYLVSSAPETAKSNEQEARIFLDICIKHELPLTAAEKPQVELGLKRAFYAAIPTPAGK